MKGDNSTSVLKKLEKELYEAAEVYRTLFEESPDAIILHREMKIILANRSAANLLDFPDPEKMIGRMVTDFIHPDFQSLIKDRREKLLDQGELDPLEQMNITEKGRTVYTEAKSIVVNYQGEPAVVTLAKDISDKKKAIDEMYNSEMMHRAILDEAGVGMGIWSTDGRLIRFNKTAVKYLGGVSEDYEGRDVIDLFGKDAGSIYIDRINDVLADGGPLIFEDEIDLPEGPRYFRSNYKMIKHGDDEEAVLIISDDVTEHRNALERLAAVAGSLDDMVNSTDEYIMVADKDGRPVQWNRAYADIMKAMIGIEMEQGFNPHTKLDDPEARAFWEDNHRRVLSGETFRVDFEWPSPDGGMLYFDVLYHPIFDGTEVTGFTEYTRDVTDIKDVENRLRNIVEHSTNLFYAHDTEHIITYLSPQSKEILGYTPEEAMMKWTETLTDHPINQIGVNSTLKAIETGKPQPPYELQLRKKDGSFIWVEVREAPVVENGVTVGMVGSLNDITERKRIREELEESEERFRRLAENAKDLIYRMSLPDGKFEYVSPSAFDVTGFDQDDFYNNQDLLIKSFHPDHVDYFKESWIKILKGENPPNFEYKIIDKQGNERWINQRNVVIKDENGSPVALEGIVTDVTESKMAEERLNHLNDLLKAIRDVNQLITMESGKGDLLSSICSTLIETSAFLTSWIITYDGNGDVIKKASAGMEDAYDLFMDIHSIKDLETCCKRVRRSDGVVTIDEIGKECTNCPLSGHYSGNSAWSISLSHQDVEYGILTVTLPKEYLSDTEFKELFQEVASDISFALHSMDLEDQRNEKERELRDNLNFTQNLIESANAIVLVLDKNADIVTFNSFAEQLTGWRKNEVIGKNWFDLFIPDPEENHVKRIFNDVVSDTDDHPGNINPIKTRSGKLKLIKWGNTKIRDMSGEVIQTLSIGVDITAQQEYQDMLRESEERFRLLAENSSDVIWTMDLEGNLLYVSPSVEKLRGYTPEEVTAQPLDELATPGSFEEVMKIFNEGIAKELSGEKLKDTIRIEMEQPCKDGTTVWTESIVRVIYDDRDDFAFILGVTRDISNKKRLSEEREEERRRAEFYLDLLSHDIGNLHQGIFSALQIARLTSDEDRKEMVLGKSEDLVRRSLKLVKNVLLLSRLKLKEPDLQPIDLEKVLHNTLDDIKSIYSTRTIDLTTDIEKGLVIRAEPIVEEIFFNLLQNGVKFQDNDIPVVSIKARSQGDVVVVEVEDHGLGITDDHKEKLFKRFSPSGIGSQSGIGLSLVKELVNRYNGSIEVEDRVEGDHSRGARFIVHLPLDR